MARCECGNRRKATDECCARCADLDGVMLRSRGQNGHESRKAEIIALLRTAFPGGATLGEIVGETGRHQAAVLKNLRDLERVGRIKRRLAEEGAVVETRMPNWRASRDVSRSFEVARYSLECARA